MGWGQGWCKTPPLQPCQHPTRKRAPAQLYRAGWRGGYTSILAGELRPRDRAAHALNARLRPRLAALGLARRWDVGEDGP